MLRPAVSGLVFAALALACGDVPWSGTSCTAMGCSSGIVLSRFPDATPLVVEETMIEARFCRNGSCAESTVAFAPEGDDGGSAEESERGRAAIAVTLPDGTKLEGSYTTSRDAAVAPSATLELTVQLDWASAKDGDRYEVRITAGTTTLFERSASAAYEEFRPNGADCEPVCHTATLTEAP